MTILHIISQEDLKKTNICSSIPSSSSSSFSSSQSIYDEIVLSLDVTRKVLNDGDDTIGSLYKALKPSGKLTIQSGVSIEEVEKKDMCLDLQLAGYLIDSSTNSGDKIEASKPGILIGNLHSLLLPPLCADYEF